MTSKYGKSAVDATRRNMLPLFLDDALAALKDDWVLSGTEYILDIPINLDKSNGSLMVFSDGDDSFTYTKAGIKCIFNEELSILTFSAVNKPSVDLQVVILMVNTNIIPAEKVKF